MQGAQVDSAYRVAEEEKAARAAQINQTAQYLAQTFPDLAEAVNAGMPMDAAWNEAMRRSQPQGGAAEMPASVREYEFARSQGFEGNFMDFQTQRGGASERSLNPTYLRGPNGEIVMSQANKSGQLDLTQVPEGYSIVNPAELQGVKTSATVDAKTAAEARAALRGAEVSNENTARAIAELRKNAPGMREWFSQIGPRGIYINPGSEMGKFFAAAEPTNNQAFMQAREMLKGGGQITDFEGRKAEDAFSRMRASLETGDMEQYLRAVADFEDAVATGYAKLVETAKGGYSAGQPGAAGNLKDKYGLE
jgi:hypothetical protein